MIDSVGMHDFRMGDEVWTMDGEKLGTVKEIRGDHFKVDVPMQPDYWLPTSCISTTGTGRVTVNFHHDHLGDWKRDEPMAA